MTKTQNKNILTRSLRALRWGFAVILACSVMLSVQTVSAGGGNSKPPIPLGCPGSPLSGAATAAQKAACSNIPLGCPGSTKQGPPAPGFDPNTCPFAPTAGSPGSTAIPATPSNATSTSKIKVDPQAQTSGKWCGAADQNRVDPVIDLGCKGLGNPILDIAFALMRFLTLGVGLVLIGSMIAAGIQYTASKGDPQATAAAIKRMVSNASALAFFIFAYAILNWLVPGGVLK